MAMAMACIIWILCYVLSRTHKRSVPILKYKNTLLNSFWSSFLSFSFFLLSTLYQQNNIHINQSINHKRRKAVTLNDELKRGHIYGTTILKSNYITSNEFRLKFLRCEFFDITKACIRYCKNLNFVYELFGDVALLRPLQMHDLSKREIQQLKGK